MTSYYNPDHYIAKIVDEFKNLAHSLNERLSGADEMARKVQKLEEMEKTIEKLEDRIEKLERAK